MKDRILVIGASGTVGSHLVQTLKQQGHDVRAATSKTLNLVTGKGIKEAFKDIDKAFLLSPPGYDDQYALLSPLIQEAKRQGLKKVVLMTAMGANAVETSPFRRAEIELEKSGISYNIIRPNWFLQNFNTFWIQGILEQKKILLPAGTAPVSFIHSRDISEVAAKLLTTDTHNNRDFDLTGPEAVTHDQVAQSISEVIGQKVSYQEIQPEELKKSLLSAGLPVGYVDFLLMIFGFLREGYNSRTTSSVEDILGRAPLSLKQYAQDYKQSWLK